MASNSTLLPVLGTLTTDEPVPFLTKFVILFSSVQFLAVVFVLGIRLCRNLSESNRHKLLTLLGVGSPALCTIVWIAYDKGSTEAWAVISCLALLPVSLVLLLIFYRADYANRLAFRVMMLTLISSLVTGTVALIDENAHYMDANVALTVITYVLMENAQYVSVTNDGNDAVNVDDANADKNPTTAMLRFDV